MAVEAGGIGARLRASREKLGLTVLQVAERIHTDPKIVDAIEAENYEALGAPVYARGHIRHYAELVGESAAELIAVYSESGKVAQPDLTRIVKAPSGLDSNKLVAPALLVIAVFAVAGAVWWVSALSKKKPQLSETHVVGEEAPAAAPESSADATAMQTQPAPSGGAGANAMQGRSGGTAAAPGGAGASGGTAMQSRPGTAVPQGAAPTPARPGGVANSGRTQGQGATASTPTTAAAQGRSGAATASMPTTAATQGRSGRATGAPTAAATQARTGRVAGSPPSPAATQVRGGSAAPPPSSGSSASVASAAAPPRSRNQAQVTLHYSADSWTEVYDASGARLFYDVGAANSVQTVVGKPPLRVVLGNASGVAVEFNGHNTSVAKLAQPDGSVQFSINRSGRVVRAKPVADGG
jgi:cytoskeleton protein RodZ